MDFPTAAGLGCVIIAGVMFPIGFLIDRKGRNNKKPPASSQNSDKKPR